MPRNKDKDKAPRKELTAVERSRIAGAYLCGAKPLNIANKLGIPKSTVYDTVKRLRDKGSEHPEKRPGPTKVLSDRDRRTLARIIKDDRSLTLTLLTNRLNSVAGTTLTVQTVRKYVRSQGWLSCFAYKKPYLNKKSARTRLAWAKEHRRWDEQWKFVVFTDESRFSLFGSDGRPRVWRKANERFIEPASSPR